MTNTHDDTPTVTPDMIRMLRKVRQREIDNDGTNRLHWPAFHGVAETPFLIALRSAKLIEVVDLRHMTTAAGRQALDRAEGGPIHVLGYESGGYTLRPIDIALLEEVQAKEPARAPDLSDGASSRRLDMRDRGLLSYGSGAVVVTALGRSVIKAWHDAYPHGVLPDPGDEKAYDTSWNSQTFPRLVSLDKPASDARIVYECDGDVWRAQARSSEDGKGCPDNDPLTPAGEAVEDLKRAVNIYLAEYIAKVIKRDPGILDRSPSWRVSTDGDEVGTPMALRLCIEMY